MSAAAVILPSLPVLVPLLAAVTCLLWYRSMAAQRIVGAGALLLNLVVSLLLLGRTWPRLETGPGMLVSQMGNWPAPFGITIAIDALAASLLAVTALVSLAAYLFILGQAASRFASGYLHPLYLLLVLGVNWAFVAGDVFNLFVSFEVMLMASYVLLAIGTTRRQMRQAYKYVVLNVLASTVFVAACGWLYGNLGTLNLAELAHISLTSQAPPGTALAVAALVFVFSAKAAVFPLWFWLPDAYPVLPTGLGAVFAALLTKVGVYALLRVLVMCFGQTPQVAAAIGPGLILAGGATMLLGALGIAGAATLRRMLACAILVGVGYMLIGPGFALTGGGAPAQTAMAGALFYMLQHMLVIAAMLLCCDLILRRAGTDELSNIGGLLERNTLLAALFFIAAMALVGIPPTSGFPGKLMLVLAGFARGDAWGWVTSLLIILASTLTLLGLARAWCAIFWSAPATTRAEATSSPWHALLAPALLVALSAGMGLFAGAFHNLTAAAAHSILDPHLYVSSVLGSGEALRQPAEAPVPEGGSQ